MVVERSGETGMRGRSRARQGRSGRQRGRASRFTDAGAMAGGGEAAVKSCGRPWRGKAGVWRMSEGSSSLFLCGWRPERGRGKD